MVWLAIQNSFTQPSFHLWIVQRVWYTYILTVYIMERKIVIKFAHQYLGNYQIKFLTTSISKQSKMDIFPFCLPKIKGKSFFLQI